MASTTEQARVALDIAKEAFDHIIQGLQDVEWEKLPEHAQTFILEHPKMTAFQLAMLLVSIVPGLVAAPVLGVLGFSAMGPVAGTAAAGFQSANGATAAFSLLQSAAMGGYGTAAVNCMVSAGSVVSGAGAGLAQWFMRSDGCGSGA